MADASFLYGSLRHRRGTGEGRNHRVASRRSVEAYGQYGTAEHMHPLGIRLLSSVLDNIPFVTAMIPLILKIGTQLFPNTGGLDEAAYHSYLIKESLPLWWNLVLGTCLGGNGTIIGASANVVVAGFSEKTRSPLNFKNYLSYGFPMMLVSIALSSAYIYLRYLYK